MTERPAFGFVTCLLAAVAIPAAAQNCLHNGEVPTLQGLLSGSEAGGGWMLRLDRPTCLVIDPLRRMKEFRVRADQNSEGTTYWLDHLSGERVSISGRIDTSRAQEPTPLIAARWVEPAAGVGNRSYVPWKETRVLLTPRPIRGVRPQSYQVLALTGKSLVVEVRDSSSREFLKPARDYATYWMSPSGELWIGCGVNYHFVEGQVAPSVSGECDDRQCYFSRPLEETAELTMRCEKQQ
jgi:hypothetical protein